MDLRPMGEDLSRSAVLVESGVKDVDWDGNGMPPGYGNVGPVVEAVFCIISSCMMLLGAIVLILLLARVSLSFV
jgi:hypothetical protein